MPPLLRNEFDSRSGSGCSGESAEEVPQGGVVVGKGRLGVAEREVHDAVDECERGERVSALRFVFSSGEVSPGALACAGEAGVCRIKQLRLPHDVVEARVAGPPLHVRDTLVVDVARGLVECAAQCFESSGCEFCQQAFSRAEVVDRRGMRDTRLPCDFSQAQCVDATLGDSHGGELQESGVEGFAVSNEHCVSVTLALMCQCHIASPSAEVSCLSSTRSSCACSVRA